MLRIKIKVPKRLGIRKRAKYDSQLPLTLEGGIPEKVLDLKKLIKSNFPLR